MSQLHPSIAARVSPATVEVLDLRELAATANREHGACEGAIRLTLDHAVAAGRALGAARGMVQEGQWRAWLANNFAGSYNTATTYVRLATHSEQIEGAATIREASQLLRGLPKAPVGTARVDPGVKEKGLQMLRDGASGKTVATCLGVSEPTVSYWRHGDENRRRDRAKRAAKAEPFAAKRIAAIRSAVAKADPQVAEAYSMAVDALAVLAGAQQALQATNPSGAAALSLARESQRRTVAAIVRALGVDEPPHEVAGRPS